MPPDGSPDPEIPTPSPPGRGPVKLAPYVPAVSDRLRWLLWVVFVLFALLSINGVYLATVTLTEWITEQTIQNWFYQIMFLGHLALGLLLILPFLIFSILHIRNARSRPNRIAVRVGYGLFATGLLILISGVLLSRLEGVPSIKNPEIRNVVYWAHVLSPIAAVWLFVLHRLAGPPIHWRVGVAVGVAALVFAGLLVGLHSQDPRSWNTAGPASGEQYFFPSLARTASGNFIPAHSLMNDEYCRECHPQVHESWKSSAHKLSSFNNPMYLFSVRETRRDLLERDGNVQASRFCAGCHDPVPFFSGAFDDPNFDDRNHPTANAGITCTGCHSITHVNSPRGNADYTIEEPVHYPFAFSDNPFLAWVNRQLVKAKPALHKKTFLKPLHRTPEFCGTCHKVHLPEELNRYKWLRAQNHYDAYHLSGVSGHGASSFYYPPHAEDDCNGCHMLLEPSTDFGSRDFDGDGELDGHDHLFPSANTALAVLLDLPPEVLTSQRRFLEGTLRVDLFAVREGGTIDGSLTAPLRPELPELQPGRRYLLDVVIRTLKLGHLFTQGTSDSNEVWLDITLRSGDRVIGRSGGQRADGGVDPWSHFVNSYVLDRDGNRIDRRNAADIFVALYNHQIPPGAADTVHYAFTVPEDLSAPIEADVKLQYRKFDTTYVQHVFGPERQNDLPITTIASDRVVFPVAGVDARPENPPRDIEAWERWNDYGIGLLRKGAGGSQKGELRQADEAFTEVERLGRADGALNRARVYFKEGRLDDAVEALQAAGSHSPPAYPWTVAWFTGLVNKQNGNLDAAIESFQSILDNRFQLAHDRGFDFSQDYRVLNELGQTLFERAKRERGAARRAERDRWLERARELFERTLEFDPEDVTAHYNLGLILARLDRDEDAARHRALHAKYKPDDNARDRVVNLHRSRNPAADHAAESVVIYDLQRDGAYELPRER